MQEPFTSVELSECDREPVHIPGAIQPFGSLVAFELPAWTVAHVSLNAADLFEIADLEALIGSSIGTILDSQVIHDLRNTFQATLISNQPERLSGVRLGPRKEEYEILVHGSGNLAIAEFIPIAGADTVKTDAAVLVKAVIDRLRRATTFRSFLISSTRQLRAITGFDRVMIYKFLEDGSGKVIAEAIRGGMDSFLDLHYPASDIPAQSRALFLRQWLRMIPDVDYTPIPIVPTLSSKNLPLDLSLSALRSASPIHRQYLRNMGVQSTMTVSIINDNQLWGLIACHHETPRRISSSTSAAVELFAQVFSTQVEAKQQRDELAYRAHAREVHDQLIASMEPEETIFQNLRRFGDLLKEMIGCDGIGVWSDNRLELDGITPPPDAFDEIVRFLNAKRSDACFSTDQLSAHLPDALRYTDRAAGLIAIPFSRAPRDFVFLFRREIVQTVLWGGDPNKAVQEKANGELSPRASFAAWKETVRGKSVPWRRAELEIAETLRISLLDVIIRRADLIDRERRLAQESQLLIVAELNHRVKNVLAVIRSLVRQSQQSATSVETFTADLQSRIHALSVAHDQLTQAHWKAAPLRELIEAEAEAWTEQDDIRLSIDGPPVMIEARAYQTLALVLHELMTNAAKYGALSVKEGRLSIDWSVEKTGNLLLSWTERNGPLVSAPSRRGFGSIIVEQSIPFELKGEARIAYDREGVNATFLIPHEFVQQQATAAMPRVEIKKKVGADLTGKSLLLVEDSMMIALDAQTMLQNCGAEVELASTSSDARRAIKLNRFDAAILDVNLYTETSFLIADDLLDQSIPFVFATGYGETVVVPEKYRHVSVVSKPYAEDTLRAAFAA